MVSNTTITFLVISTILCFLFPVLLVIIVKRRSEKIVLPILVGALGFFVMQVMFRLPIVQLSQLMYDFEEVNIFLLAFILGFSAALVETLARFVTLKFFVKKDQRFSVGVAHGIGHGAVEAIILVGFSYITYIMYSNMINNGTFDQFTSLPDVGVIYELTKETLIETPSYMFLLAGIERVLAILFHISLSVLTIFGIRSKSWKPIGLVLLIHTLFDASVVIMGRYGLNVVLIEVYIFLVVIIMLYVTREVFKKYVRLEEGVENV